MAKAKESIKLKSIALSSGQYEYKVLELVNRLEPGIGYVLTHKQMNDLILEANRIGSTLTIKVV